MKRFTIKTALALTAVLGLNNCGSGGGGSTSIAIDTYCTDKSDIASYTHLHSGDIITKGSEDTVVKIYHNQNKEKFVCIESGSATISQSEDDDHGLVK